ncbi:MAG: SRPBCC domain-containing protein [Actinobacteria bacterium]|nr:SRPBCC domain-containing protein [Actinomycetota bacterium]
MAGVVATAEVRVAAPVERVWSALTDPAEVRAWMFGTTLVTDWAPGSPITWSGEYEGRAYADRGEVVEVLEPTTLVVTHFSPLGGLPDVPENYHRLVYHLSGDSKQTLLSLSQDNNADEAEAARSRASWTTALEALKAHLEGL